MGVRGSRVVLGVLVAGLLAPAPAQAGTAFVVGAPGSRSVGYLAGSGEQGTLTVETTTGDSPVVRFTEVAPNPVAASPGCVVPDPAVRTVECALTPTDRILIGTGDGADTIEGLVGYPAVIDAGAGDDVVRVGGFGDATEVIGGSGTDLVTYADRHLFNVDVSLDDVANDGTMGVEGDQIRGDVEIVEGTPQDDTLVGNDGSQELRGGAGGDALSGGGGADLLSGGEDGDILHGGSGGDILDAGPGCDVLDGGEGDDLLQPRAGSCATDVRGGGGRDRLDLLRATDAAQYASLDDVADDGLLEADSASNYHSDIEDLTGGAAGDLLVGGPGANVIRGGAGDDLLDGAGGADELHGDAGTDLADYSLRTQRVRASLNGVTADDGEVAEGDSIAADVEGILGGEGPDDLFGGPGDDLLYGGAGDDVLTDTAGGEDLIDADAGNDDIRARDGRADLVVCGPGQDVVDRDAEDQLDGCESTRAPSGGVTQTPAPDPPRVRPGAPRAPRPIATPAPDTRAPRVALFARTGTGLVGALRRTSLRLRVGCDEPCAATATLTAHAATARSLARRGFRRGTIAARGTSQRGVLSALTLKPTSRGKRMLRALRSGRYRLTVVATDTAGNRTTVRRTVVVRR